MEIEKAIEELAGKFTYALLSPNGANEIRLKQTISIPKSMKRFDELNEAVVEIIKNNFARNEICQQPHVRSKKTSEIIGGLILYYETNNEFKYFDFATERSPNLNGSTKDEIEIDGIKLIQHSTQTGSADHGFYGEIYIKIPNEDGLYFRCGWAD